LSGLKTYLPLKKKEAGGGGTLSARYCYSVWLRHLVIAHQNGLPTHFNSVAELGPGDSIGTGLAAILTGAKKYYAFDVVNYAANEENIRVFDELVELFKKREKIPDNKEFPFIRPLMESHEFPCNILPDELLDTLLDEKRITSIRNALLNIGEETSDNYLISYIVPWDSNKLMREIGTIDIVFSQAVIQCIEDIDKAFKILHEWLSNKGFMSHQIDFSTLLPTEKWNEHWTYSELIWKLIKGRRTYLFNRSPHSFYIKSLEKCGFSIACDIREKLEGISRKELSSNWLTISDEDLNTTCTFIQAIKKY